MQQINIIKILQKAMGMIPLIEKLNNIYEYLQKVNLKKQRQMTAVIKKFLK